MEILRVFVGLGIVVAVGGFWRSLSSRGPTLARSSPLDRWMLGFVFLWGGVVVWLSLLGSWTPVSMGGPPRFLWGWLPAGLLVVWTFSSKSADRWVRGLPRTVLAGLHVSRLATGIAMLHASGHGVVPAFGIPAGMGGVLVGILAVVVERRKMSSNRTLDIWNALGVLDILVAMVLGGILGGGAGSQPDLSLRFPLVVVPAFLVPFYLITHLWIHRARLAGGAPR